MSDYYCKCKDCEYIDPSERKNSWCWYCGYYGTYEDIDIVRECKHHKKRW